MTKLQNLTTRRGFMSQAAAVAAVEAAASGSIQAATGASNDMNEFTIYQERRRQALWGLLGDLPWQHKPAPPKVIRTEDHGQYTLTRLVLDLNGVEPVPALLLIPKRLQHPAPGLLFIHWHAGMYDLGKEQLIRGTSVQPAYA